jgi:hypothetical protein
LPTAVCSEKKAADRAVCAVSICFQIPIQKTRRALNLKRFSQDGGGQIFLKISAPLSLINTFQMNLISAGSISLDSIFREAILAGTPTLLLADYRRS